MAAPVLTAVPTRADDKRQALVNSCLESARKVLGGKDFPDAAKMMSKARAVLIIPELVQGGFILGAAGGRGVLMVRTHPKDWSPPAFYGMGSGSLGLQIGAKVSEIVFIFRTEKGLKAILDQKFKFGAEAGVTLVAVGVGAAGATTAAVGAPQGACRPSATMGRVVETFAQPGSAQVSHRAAKVGFFPGADAVPLAEGNTDRCVTASAWPTRRGRRPWHVRTLLAREPGDLMAGQDGVPYLVSIGKAMSRFTALLHHADVELLRRAFLALKPGCRAGVDGTTWQDYEAGDPATWSCVVVAKWKATAQVSEQNLRRLEESIFPHSVHMRGTGLSPTPACSAIG